MFSELWDNSLGLKLQQLPRRPFMQKQCIKRQCLFKNSRESFFQKIFPLISIGGQVNAKR